MKKIILITLILFSFTKGNSQDLESYFIPAKEYINSEFIFESDRWENNSGEFYENDILNYSFDYSSRNYRIDYDTKTYINGKLRVDEIYGMYKSYGLYDISVNNIVKTYFWMKAGFSNGSKNEIKLKTPPSQWIVNDEDGAKYYKCEEGSVITPYAHYPDCIVVSQTFSTNSSNVSLKNLARMSTKKYYAKNIGFVKVEEYLDGKEQKNITDYPSQRRILVDNFSSYSFYQKKLKREIEARQQEQERLEKIELEKFLRKRRTTTYKYEQLDAIKYDLYKNKLNEELTKICLEKASSEPIDIKLEIIFKTDTLGNTNVKINPVNPIYLPVEANIMQYLNTFKLEPVTTEKYKEYIIFAEAKYTFSFNYEYEENSLRIKSMRKNKIESENKDQEAYSHYRTLIDSSFMNKKLPYGKWDITASKRTINGNQIDSVQIIKYKSFAGPAAVFPTILMPGMGDRLVTGGAKLGFGKLLVCYGLIGGGIFSNIQSHNSYKKYYQASIESDIESYYNKANNYNKVSYMLIGTGALIWIHDIFWVYKKGRNNKVNQREIKTRFNLAFNYNNNRNYQIGFNYKF